MPGGSAGSALRFDEINRMASGESDPFEATDAVVSSAARRCVRAFSRLSSRLSTLDDDMDDYVVMLWVWELYDDLWQAYVSALGTCFERAYSLVSVAAPPGDAVSSFLSTAQPIEGWVPRGEWERKRSYLFESLVAARASGASKRKAVDFARKRWGRQLSQSADDVTAIGMRRAYSDAGVTRVRWVTQRDERVCETCGPRDGRVYRVDRMPQYLAHYGCRCVLVPVEGGEAR